MSVSGGRALVRVRCVRTPMVSVLMYSPMVETSGRGIDTGSAGRLATMASEPSRTASLTCRMPPTAPMTL
jgi:hypothetical protein